MTQHPYFPIACPDHQGTLLLTPCPGTVDADLEDSLGHLKAAGATAVITLMTWAEMTKHGVEAFAENCGMMGIRWFHLPVEDEGAPTEDFATRWRQVRIQIHQCLDHNESVVIHCKGGSGRTGVVAAQILMERGVPMDEAVQQVKTLRPNAFSHAVQIRYIEQLASQI